MQETELYAPVKAYLESQGYEVKAEVNGCDVVARRGDEPIVIVELKLALNIELILQAIERQKLTDAVYVAVPDDRAKKSRTVLRRAPAEVLRLTKLLGLGLIVVQFRASGATVEVRSDPAPYKPRKSARKRARLLREFEALRGDPNTGGSRGSQVTAYRQDAVACAVAMRGHDELRPADVRAATGVVRAGRILYDNHYGWFEHVGPGRYRLNDAGRAGLEEYRSIVETLAGDG